MFCPNCGKQIPDGGRFCPECGSALDVSGGSIPPVSPEATSSYDSLGTSYQTPPTMVEPDGPAGKSPRKGHGGIVALVVVAVVAVLAAIMLTPIHKSIPGLSEIDIALPGATAPADEEPASDDPKGQAPANDRRDSSSSSEGSGAAAKTKGKRDDGGTSDVAPAKSPLVGTWTGNLSGDSDVTCVASQTKTPTVTIKSVDPETGTVTADITFNFHNHESDQDGTEDGDEQVELKGLEFMLADAQTQDGQVVAGTFHYKPSMAADFGTEAVCEISGQINTRRLTIAFYECGGDNGSPYDRYRDTYVLTKD